MHQDQRIGLALAVLLIGAVGAFFFRNDPQPAGSSPRLKTARALDARIAEKAIGPYLQNNDDRDSAGLAARNVATPTGTDASRLPHLDTPDFGPDDQSPRDRRQANINGDTVQELDAISVPDPNERSVVGDRADRTAKSANSSDKIHVVQKGETLSSIAAKEMGSSGKFQELFEANRDHLNDANDVRVGMSLRIPSRGTAKTQSTSSKTRDRVGNSAPPLLPADPRRAETGEFPAITVNPDKQPGNPDKQPGNPDKQPGNPDKQSGRPADSSPPKKKFEPVKRPPLGIKGMGTQSSEAEPASKPIRKLTQLPPGDNGGKIAR